MTFTKTSSKCHRHWIASHMRDAPLSDLGGKNRAKPFHQTGRHMADVIPHSQRSSTLRFDGRYFTYIISTKDRSLRAVEIPERRSGPMITRSDARIWSERRLRGHELDYEAVAPTVVGIKERLHSGPELSLATIVHDAPMRRIQRRRPRPLATAGTGCCAPNWRSRARQQDRSARHARGEPDLDFTRLTGSAASGGQVEVHGMRPTSAYQYAILCSSI